jgi:hypothetical protein
VGGEVRLGRSTISRSGGETKYEKAMPGFWVNYTLPQLSSYLKPVVAVNLFSERAYAAFAHEMEHFRYWKEIYLGLLAQGMEKSEAVKQAYLIADREENLIHHERKAVEAEIAAEQTEDQLFNRRRHKERPRHDEDFGIVNRRMYPEFESLRRVLLRLAQNPHDERDLAQARDLMRIQIEYAVKMREQNMNNKTGMIERMKSVIYGRDETLTKWETSPLIDMLALPFGIERLEADLTVAAFMQLYLEVIKDLGLPNDLPSSEFLKFAKNLGLKDPSNQQQQQQQ